MYGDDVIATGDLKSKPLPDRILKKRTKMDWFDRREMRGVDVGVLSGIDAEV